MDGADEADTGDATDGKNDKAPYFGQPSGLSLEDFDPGSERSLTLISCLSKLLGLCVLSLLRRVMPSSTATLNLELRAQVFSEVWEAWEGSEVGACLRGDNWITVEGTRLQLKHLAAADLYRLLCNTPKHGRAHRSIALYLFGAYAPEQYQDAELRDHLFGKAFSSVREMADKHRLLPATGDIAASKQALLKALIEGEAPYGLQYDAELLPYLEFSPSDVHKVVMRTNCRKIRKGWDTLLSLAVTYPAAWPLNRLASSGIGLLIIPGYAAFQEMYNELGISMLPIQHAVKALKELHTIMRLLHCSALHWYEGREVLPQSMPELAHCLYHQCLLGRNDFGADIGAEALNRSVKLKPRVAPDEESMSWTTDAYEAIEQVELHRLWTRTAELADADSVVDFDDMSDKWFSILGSGYGKQSKLTYQDGMELNDSHNASRAQVDLIEHMHQSGELKHGLRAKRKAFAEMRETMEDLGKRNAEEQASPTIAVAHSKLRSIDDVLGRVALLGGSEAVSKVREAGDGGRDSGEIQRAKEQVSQFLEKNGFKAVDHKKKGLGGLFCTCPLHVAADQNDVKMVGYLLRSGADVNLKDGRGRTAADCIKNKSSHAEVYSVLQAWREKGSASNRPSTCPPSGWQPLRQGIGCMTRDLAAAEPQH
ncbi:hypothetical protein AK812_SmicGene38787 [Symbiodinium microadriaticum]|uniref:Uncharacterized protein n=1 Tax=Symbiodinium microadriaticum TaxID=2951 RepID=A0A1Q9CCW5_SYMMI|nr:hypothetical protein AK812_SmicGene38787 [Symbiodinium microadriaticum]